VRSMTPRQAIRVPSRLAARACSLTTVAFGPPGRRRRAPPSSARGVA
jgi:hypothetical protein